MSLKGAELEAHMQPRLELLRASAEAMRQECLALRAEDFDSLQNGGAYSESWGAFPLWLELWGEDFPGIDLRANRARCPRTVAVLDQLDGLVMSGFMRLAPGGRIVPHSDLREDRVIRAFLSLQLPPYERQWWPELTTRLLDVRHTHQAWNDWDRARHVLCCDFRLEVEVPTGATSSEWTPAGLYPDADGSPPEAASR